MRHIHPFPARMAPEIALDRIKVHSEGSVILDPMAGSGMVLAQAARSGMKSIGIDLDPLAHLISKVGSSRVSDCEASDGLDMLLRACKAMRGGRPRLPWIDDHPETQEFIGYWFHEKQNRQLRRLAYHLVHDPVAVRPAVLNVLKIALSRLIVTKEPKASLARDTAHSRPHRTITDNDFDVMDALPASLAHVLVALDAKAIRVSPKVHLGDARNLTMVSSASVDRIITSPPYLNAIDYMRGHRLSLVWLGYSLDELRKIRATSIGAEKAAEADIDDEYDRMLKQLKLGNLSSRNRSMLHRYYMDLQAQTAEAGRVLKRGAIATYVIGNSTINGVYVRNSEILKCAGRNAGLIFLGESERDIPAHRRYMPLPTSGTNSLSTRMRTEHIIEFVKE